MPQAKLSSKNHIVILRKAGDRPLVVGRDERVISLEKPKLHHAAIRGLGRRAIFPGNGKVGIDRTAITMTELLVPACRGGTEQKADEFYALFTTYPNLDWIAPSLEIADMATKIRATHRLGTSDALQAATAVHARATASRLWCWRALYELVSGFPLQWEFI